MVTVAAGGIVVALVSPVAGAGTAAVAMLVALLVVWLIAGSRAEDEFHRSYAAQRSLTGGPGKCALPTASGLLGRGVRRYAEAAWGGTLPGGLEGVLALYTYETETRDHKGNKQVSYHRFTVVLAEIPGAHAFVSELACQRRAGFRFLDSAEDVFRNRRRVETESIALDERFEIFIGEHDEMGRARQILSPTFIDWLSSESEELAFELDGGMLVANIEGHHDSVAELDGLCEVAAKIATRLKEEVAESVPASGVGRFDPRAVAKPAETGATGATDSSRVIGVLGAIVLVVAACIGGLSALAEETDENRESGPRVGFAVNQGPRVKTLDDELIPAFGRNGRADIVDLYATGIRAGDVNLWALDAVRRGLIELRPAGYTLTKEGEKLAKELGIFGPAR